MAVRGRITIAQVASHRPSYINALLIQRAGSEVDHACTACRMQQETNPNGWARPFPDCVRLSGLFGGSCGNCKWKDHAARCSVRDPAQLQLPTPGRVRVSVAAIENRTQAQPAGYVLGEVEEDESPAPSRTRVRSAVASIQGRVEEVNSDEEEEGASGNPIVLD